MGITFLVMMLFAAIWQSVLFGYTVVLAGHAANEGARRLAVHQDFRGKAVEDLPAAWRDDARVSRSGNSVVVRLTVPVFMPGLNGPLHITSSSGTVVE
jgi:pilus assembly protein CpaE